MPRKILILGGTKDSRIIAARLIALGHDVMTSLAGVTENPKLPEGKIRIGGFGGADGLRSFLHAGQFDALIDATHPYAAVISRNAAEAVTGTSVQYIRFDRPPWSAEPGQIIATVDTVELVIASLPPRARVFLAIGRKQIEPFFKHANITGVVRMIEPPAIPVPDNWMLILGYPQQSVDAEMELMRQHRISHLICKNAGGSDSEAKLKASALLGIPTIMLKRPEKRGGLVFQKIEDLVTAFNNDANQTN